MKIPNPLKWFKPRQEINDVVAQQTEMLYAGSRQNISQEVVDPRVAAYWAAATQFGYHYGTTTSLFFQNYHGHKLQLPIPVVEARFGDADAYVISTDRKHVSWERAGVKTIFTWEGLSNWAREISDAKSN